MASLFQLPSSILYAALKSNFRPSHLYFSTASYTTSPPRTYASALKLLNSLQSNRAVVSSIATSALATPQSMNSQAIPEMLEWTRKAGYEVEDLVARGLRCIHVAGTKGKGSVSVMVENILLQYWNQDNKIIGRIGLYTSPHLVHVRERIRIDGLPISEDLFTRYFYQLWDRFSQAAALAGSPGPESAETKPGYFRYLTLLALHTFIQEGVQTAIVECGIGGEYDSTNILPPEAVTASAITSLGIDHKGMLGDTIEEIAWHKGGIMKSGVPAFTVEQTPTAQAALEKRAKEKDIELTIVERLPVLDTEQVKLGLEGGFQKDNASLAIAVASSHLRTLGILDAPSPLTTDLPALFIKGLETVAWPARCQTIIDGNITWLIDGAHTEESLSATALWFRQKLHSAHTSSNPPTATMLIFNQADRDGTVLLSQFFASLRKNNVVKLTTNLRRMMDGISVFPWTDPKTFFTYAAFCTNRVWKAVQVEGENIDVRAQKEMAKVYSRSDGNQLVMVYGSVEEAVDLAQKVSEEEGERVLVLVTGSLHLAGGVLEILDRRMKAEAKIEKESE